jgi:hypothetical protein
MSIIKKVAAPLGAVGGFLLGGPAGAAIGGSLGSAVSGSSDAKRQEQAITNAANQSTALQREQFDYLKSIMQPYQQTGASALPQLQAFVNAPQEKFNFDYQAYFNSPEYAAMAQQAEQDVLRNASATGGFRSGNTQVALASLAPQLAQQGLGNAMEAYQLNQASNVNKYNQFMGLAGLGQGTAAQMGNAAQGFGANAGQNALIAGNARANRIGAQNQAIGGFATDVGGLLMRGF